MEEEELNVGAVAVSYRLLHRIRSRFLQPEHRRLEPLRLDASLHGFVIGDAAGLRKKVDDDLVGNSDDLVLPDLVSSTIEMALSGER